MKKFDVDTYLFENKAKEQGAKHGWYSIKAISRGIGLSHDALGKVLRYGWATSRTLAVIEKELGIPYEEIKVRNSTVEIDPAKADAIVNESKEKMNVRSMRELMEKAKIKKSASYLNVAIKSGKINESAYNSLLRIGVPIDKARCDGKKPVQLSIGDMAEASTKINTAVMTLTLTEIYGIITNGLVVTDDISDETLLVIETISDWLELLINALLKEN